MSDADTLRFMLDGLVFLSFGLGISAALVGIGTWRLVQAWLQLKRAPKEYFS